MTDILTAPASFLRSFMNALQRLPKLPSWKSGGTIMISGTEYFCKWDTDETLVLETGKDAPYITARYLFQEDIEACEEVGEEHWAGSTPRWLYCGIMQFIKNAEGETKEVINHHFENGEYRVSRDEW